MCEIVTDINLLKRKSTNVETVIEALDIINKLENTLKKISNGVGLSAIQIGIPKKVSIVKQRDGNFLHLINPEIVEKSDEFVFFGEGCLSFPNVYINTKRYRTFVIKNMFISDDKFEEENGVFYSDTGSEHTSDIESIAAQHEIEHCLGETMFDSEIKPAEQRIVDKEVSRNDPCPCGSGKKYKKCCGP